MANHRSRQRRRYLRRELHVIHGAVEAARILGEALATDQLGPDRDHRRAPRAITSLLTLVEERLSALRRAARHSRAPQHCNERRAAGWEGMSPDERLLAMRATQQRAGTA